MGTMALPPGFRFHPTDDELVGYYLQRKVDGLTIELEVIPVIDLYKFDPWELPDKSFLPKRDMEWFFFCPRDKKYPNGSRTNRATASGYWKATGKDRKVLCESSAQGLRKTLVFYRGRAPGGERTDWVMHEYRLCEDLMQATPNFMGAFALCRVMKRNENGQKSGDLQGESRAKRGRPSAQSDFSPRKQSNNFSGSSERNPSEAASLFEICSDSTPITSPDENARGTEIHPIVIDTDQASFWDSNVLSDPSKAFFSEEGIFSESIIPTQFLYSTESCPPCNLSPVSSYSSFTENGFLIDELNGGGCFTSFPSPLHCMDLYGNEDEMILQSFGWEMPRYMNPLFSGVEVCSTMSSPSICRQASDLEEGSLWRQEDSLVVVM